MIGRYIYIYNCVYKADCIYLLSTCYIWRLMNGANPSTSCRSTSALCKGGSTSITTLRFRKGSRLDSVTLWQ